MRWRRPACFRVRRCAALVAIVSVVVLAAGPGSRSVRAQDAPISRVLVMPFAVDVADSAPGGAGTALWLGEAASILLSESLAARDVPALSRDERVSVFSRLNLPMSAALTRATTIRVAELVGASDVIVGEVNVGERLDVRARRIRIATGQEVPAVTGSASLATMFDLFGQLAAGLSRGTGRAPAERAVTALPVEAFENYVKGLVASTPAAQQRFLEMAQREVPQDPRILMALWTVYSAQALHDKALAAANAVPASTSASASARFAVALSLIELRRFDGAYQALTQLYGTTRSAAVANALGVVQLRRGTVPPGSGTPATYFRRAVDAAPEEIEYLFNLGYAHALAQSPTDAITWLREVVRFDSADGDAHRVLSAVLATAGRSVEAQRELDLARLLGTAVDQTSRTPSRVVPAGLERLAATPELVPGVRLSQVSTNPNQRDQGQTAAFHLSNARALIAAKRDRDATNELRRAIYLAPYEDEPHLLLGQVYYRGGQLPQAIDEFKVALWCRESAAAHVALAGALLDVGDRAGARRAAQQALALAPGSTDAQALLSRIGN